MHITVPFGVAMPCRTVVAGAVPVWIGDRLNTEPHRGAIVHAGNDAVYFTSHSDVIGVISRHATAIPCVIATRLNSVQELFAAQHLPAVGDTVEIGSGAVSLDNAEVHIGRFVDFQMRRFSPDSATLMRERLVAVAGDLNAVEISAEVLRVLTHRPSDALLDLLGKGSGLTPFGDDVVCGMLATLLAAGDPCAEDFRTQALQLAPQRTTLLSTTLLRRAAAGDVLAAFAQVVSDLLDHPDHLAQSIAALVSIGHTSGAGMALGLKLGLDHMRSCCP